MLEFFQSFDVAQIISAVLMLLSIFLGSKYALAFGKIGKVGKLLTDFVDATKDKKVTPEELEILKKILKIKIKKFGTFVVIQSYIAEKKLELHAIQLQNQKK